MIEANKWNATTMSLSGNRKGDNGISLADDADVDDDVSYSNNKDDDDWKGLSGDLKCSTKFWKCIGGVVKNGAHYLQEPGGLTE